MKKTIKKVWTEYNQEYLNYLKSIPEKDLSLEEWQDLGIFEADAEIERGEVYTHEEVVEHMRKIIAADKLKEDTYLKTQTYAIKYESQLV